MSPLRVHLMTSSRSSLSILTRCDSLRRMKEPECRYPSCWQFHPFILCCWFVSLMYAASLNSSRSSPGRKWLLGTRIALEAILENLIWWGLMHPDRQLKCQMGSDLLTTTMKFYYEVNSMVTDSSTYTELYHSLHCPSDVWSVSEPSFN